ncbi:TlpA family protein disulfide reductase [Sinomicrobium weinanense]|uniref:TlpA family protein disulfide reductase n=1 Tax=Sinomicrobium weinanense TaxID=2842200 RepID=A0A926Q0Q0_9FLAO|nr:TlpA disulfide reductase family protein [Sinomicrobium weinanense]MBC9795127.1 TlpA family protein disulfide reductase [Sinomicrobium weinanense]MBU3123741.1 TlpA family protein disulfide reductase [Sinomicrobium weinanense]
MKIPSSKIVTVFWFVMSIACAQTSPDKNIRVLDLDEKVPNYPLANLINFPEETASISDFKGKTLILDYWFTGCKPCIASWPKLLELQQKFGDKIQIVLVNHMQDKTTVQKFIDNWSKNEERPFTLPSVTGDTTLYKAFPPSGYPSVVWINEEGNYKAFTNGGGLNEKNIQYFLNGKIKKMVGRENIKRIKKFDVTKPLYIDGNGGDTRQMLWYSTVSAYSPEVRDGVTWFIPDTISDSGGYGLGILLTHTTILEMIRYAYSLHDPRPGAPLNAYPRLPENRYILAAKDSIRYLNKIIKGRRYLPNLYTYQLISQEPKTFKQLKKKMQEDIQVYFNVNIRWEKRKRKCLVLKAEDTTLISDFKNGKEKVLYTGKDATTKKIVNHSPSRFLAYLNSKAYFYCPYPLIDEMRFKGLLDIEFPTDLSDDYKKHKEFDQYLYKKYKIHFVLEEREVDILVIQDSEDDRAPLNKKI